MIYLRLFFEFCRAGLFAVGGGLATLPFLQDISERTGWFTTDQLADMVAVSECTPGLFPDFYYCNNQRESEQCAENIRSPVEPLACAGIEILLLQNLYYTSVYHR